MYFRRKLLSFQSNENIDFSSRAYVRSFHVDPARQAHVEKFRQIHIFPKFVHIEDQDGWRSKCHV